MKEFLNSLKPVSTFAYFCLGFILGERLLHYQSWKLFFIIGLILFLSFILLKLLDKKIFYTLVGFSFATLIYANLDIYFKHKFITKEVWLEISQTQQSIKLIPQKQIKKNFFLFDVHINEQKWSAIFYHSSKIGNSENYECPVKEIYLKEVEDIEVLEFLKYYNHIYFKINRKNCKKTEVTDLRFLIRKEIEAALDRGEIEGESKAIALGVLLGDSSYLSFGLKSRAKEAGILHIFAASGLHIGVLAGFIYGICSFVRILPRYVIKIIPIIISFLYLWILNFPVSLTRAFFFLLFLTLASLVYRKIYKSDLMVVSAFFVLLLSREEFLSISFLLSFGAVGGILFFKNIFDKLLFGELKNWFTDLFTVSLSASLGTFPILVYYFKSYSFGSILINLIIIPIVGILLPFLYLGIFFEVFSLGIIADYFWFYADLQLGIVSYLTQKINFLSFYKEFNESIPILILFVTWLIVILVLYEISLIMKSKKHISFLRKFGIQILSLLTVSSLFILGFQIASGQNQILNSIYKEGFFLYNSSFAVRQKETLYIADECYYHNSKMRRWIFSHNVKEIWIEKESCLFYGVYFYETQRTTVNVTFSKTEFSSLFPYVNYLKQKFPKNFQLGNENLIFFSPETDKLSELTHFTKSGTGKICLIFSRFSRDNLEDWKKFSKYFGIPKEYQISDCKENLETASL